MKTTKEIAPSPFTGYLAFYPIYHKKEGRNYTVLYPIKGTNLKRTTISYGKYILSIKLGIWLTKHDTVDHIDGNKLNDSIENLQILSNIDNIRKHNITNDIARKLCEMICPNCEKTFIIEENQSYLHSKSVKNNFCSRKCRGIFVRNCQLGRISKDEERIKRSNNLIRVFKDTPIGFDGIRV